MGGIQKTVRRGWEYFRERGLREAARRTVLHFERKISERRYVRRMMPTEEELAAQRKDCAAWAPRFSVIVPLYNTPMDVLRDPDGLALRPYQIRAIEKVEEAIRSGRKAVLLAMATGERVIIVIPHGSAVNTRALAA